MPDGWIERNKRSVLAAVVAVAVGLIWTFLVGESNLPDDYSAKCKALQQTPAAPLVPVSPTNASNTDVVLALTAATAWQPRGGKVQFTIASKPPRPKDMKVSVSFGWQHTGASEDANVPSPQVDVVSSGDSVVTFAATVPDLPLIPDQWPNRLWRNVPCDTTYHYLSAGLVPVAEMRVQASDGGLVAPFNTVREIGITSVWSARSVAAVAALLAFGLLSLSARTRGVPGRYRPILGIISTPDGYASLSQFQLIAWSFVVGVGAVYVLTLSGGLIDVPNQMLVLLGISSVAALGARLPDRSTKPDTPELADPTTNDVGGLVAPAPNSLGVSWNPAKSRKYDIQYKEAGASNWTLFAHSVVHEWCRITGLQRDTAYVVQVRSTGLAGGAVGDWSGDAFGRTLPAPREPRWSDLTVADDPHQIDVTRVQMLFFTLIAASFVTIRLFNSYEIPAVPDGFLWLMGLSNGVYLSAKFVPQ